MLTEIISKIVPIVSAADSPTTLIPDSSGQYATLSEKISSGNFEIYDIAPYIIYLIEFLIYMAGGLAILFVIIGGYQYIVGGGSDSKDAGKKTIGYALAGFAVSVLAWAIVNFIQVWLTSS